MSDDNTISVTDLDLLSFEYTETAEEYPLLEMGKTLSKNPLKNNGNITKTAEELGLSRASCTEDLKN
jgi:transcriptional regulator of acetoin/glycerol metabolism